MTEPVGKYLSIAWRAHASYLDDKLKDYEISHGQMFILIALYKNEAIYQNTLCKMYNVDKSAIGRGIAKLRNKGFIIKKTHPKDKRKQLIYLTDKAKKFKPILYKILKSAESKLRSNLSKDEVELFLEIIKKMCTNLGANIECHISK